MSTGRSGWTVDRALLADRDADATLFVETPDVTNAALALVNASPRLALVTFDGREFSSYDDWAEADSRSGGAFGTTNANFVFDVETTPEGAYIWLDTKGAITAAMGRTVTGIVIEELTRLGVPPGHLRPVTGADQSR
jgi:hypothetical protein